MTSSLVLGLDAHGTTETHFEEPVHRSKPDHSTLYGGENQGYEKRRGSIHNSSSNGLTRTISAGVDVERAELDFAQLNRQFSAYSELGRQISKQQTGQHPVAKANDVEKQIKSDESSAEPWDLEATLRGASAADREAGIKVKRIGVTWENLTVRGIGGERNIVKTFPDAFVDFFNLPGTIMSLSGWGRKGKEINILQEFRGVAKPSEMILVLGRPGSGCSTFLKVISNQRFGYTGVDGQVTYGSFDAKTFAKGYRGEAVYNQEDDVHHPSLTVGQTLGFALDTKTPGKRPSGMSKKEFKETVVALLLKMFNIEHTKDTVVGGPFMRGISGGERKRVSIAETMTVGAAVCAWDGSTRGLDASTALDYAKSLRIITNIYQTTTFVSLYQASESIYEQFDKVLVIDSGRQVYFGPTGDARSYFKSLGFVEKPRQTTADYLTSCTNEFEREYQTGRSATNAPSSPDSFVEAFNRSNHAVRLEKEMTNYKEQVREEKASYDDFHAAHYEAKRKHTPKSSVYSIPFYLQIWALTKRQFAIKWQDKFSLTVSWVTSITIALIIGSIWLNSPQTSAGAFTRGGVLFISLLFNAFQAFGELPSTMLGRPIVNKHKAYTFHRPSALWLAQILIDLAFAAVKILVFSIIVYFMCGLALDVGAFFTFVLIILTGYLALTLFFRTIGCFCPDFDYAYKFVACVLTLFVLCCGYLIQFQSQHVWLRWIFWINPLGLGFSAMMMNEFKRIDLVCTMESLIPSGLGYSTSQNQVCTLPGSKPSVPSVTGSDYIVTAFSYNPSDLWRNWGLMLVLTAFYLVMNTTLGELVQFGAGGRTITFFQKENKERKKLNEELQQKKQRRLRKEATNAASDLNITSKAILTWENLTYDVPTPAGQLRLLSDVFGYVRPGELTALMGASGAGKTTLLDVLAARKNVGVISGDVLVDGVKPGRAFQRGTAYAEQQDVHESTQTVREALRFSADLRQPFKVLQKEKYNYVEEVISLLELEDLADAIIGDPNAGLTVEERKRVTIGVELAAKPELLLFLDEPTSGLDSESAFNIVRFLRKLAGAGQAILCTIHQPNSTLFENFDRLLLLQRGGECVYFGDIGEDAQILIDYFHRRGADCPPRANAAEWMLDAIGAGMTARIGDKDWGEVWRESEEFAATKQSITEMKAARAHAVVSAVEIQEKEYATPLIHQIRMVVWRQQISYWRSPNYGFTQFFNQMAISIFTGLAFSGLDNSRTSLQYRVFIIFQVTVLPVLILAQVEPKYDISRLIFYRESAAKTYKQFPFALSMVMAELPYSIICAVGFFLPLYYIPGFQSDPSRAGYQFLMVLIVEIFSATLGQTLAALTPSFFISSLLNPFVTIVFVLFCGITIPKPQIPQFWRVWLYDLVPFTRLVGGMVSTELQGRIVQCTDAEYNRFAAPEGLSCGDYMAAFFERGGSGYLRDNVTSSCEYCAFKVGEEFYQPFGFRFEDRWRDLGIMAAFIGTNLILLFGASRFLNFNRR